MIAVALWAGLGLVGLCLALVLLPVRIRIRARSTPRPWLRVDLRPLAGLAPWIAIVDSARPRRPRAAAPSPEPPRPRRARPRRRSRFRPTAGRLIRAAPALARGILRVFRIERLHLDATFGLGDPADTGTAWGLVAPVLQAVRGVARGPLSVSLVPDFDRPRLEGEVDGVIRVMPARAIPAALRFAWAAFGPAR